jgi:hypothetical protein
MRTPTFFLLFSASLALSAFAFQQPGSSCVALSSTRSSLPNTSSNSISNSISNIISNNNSPREMPALSPLFSAHFASGGEDETAAGSVAFSRMVRNRLRRATGFSFTVFRATLRGITGISLTALYAGALAASGLWIRKTMSVGLGVFPSGFRYFLQPFLILYYTPLILVKSLASPTTRKRAVAKHETVLEAWKEAVVVAEKTERNGYWPVVVSDDGYFELTKPPSVDGVIDESESESGPETKMAEAMAATVEQAMELKSDDGGDDENKK